MFTAGAIETLRAFLNHANTEILVRMAGKTLVVVAGLQHFQPTQIFQVVKLHFFP